MKNYKHLTAYILLAVFVCLSFSQTRTYRYDYKVSNTSSATKSKVNSKIKFLFCDIVSLSKRNELYMSMNFLVQVNRGTVQGREYSYSCMYYNDKDLEYVVSLTIRNYSHDRAEYWSIDTDKGIMTIKTMNGNIYKVEFKENYFISWKVN